MRYNLSLKIIRIVVRCWYCIALVAEKSLLGISVLLMMVTAKDTEPSTELPMVSIQTSQSLLIYF